MKGDCEKARQRKLKKQQRMVEANNCILSQRCYVATERNNILGSEARTEK